MRHLLILISLLSTLSFIGCRDESDAIYLIDRAESLLKSDPDSSHILLDSIAVPDNLSDKLLARWCMLSGKVADTLYTDLPYVQQLLRAQAYYKSHGTKQEQAKIGLYLGRSYVEDKENEKAEGNWEKAWFYLDEYNSASDSILTIRNRENIIKIEKEYEHLKISLENMRLKSDKQKYFIYWVISVSILLILLWVFQIRIDRKNKRLLKQEIDLSNKSNELFRLRDNLRNKQDRLEALSIQLSEKNEKLNELDSREKLEKEYEQIKKEEETLVLRIAERRKDLFLSSAIAKKVIKLSQKVVPGATKSPLSEKDWQNIITQVNEVYPFLADRLAAFNLSAAELRYCYLSLLGLDSIGESILLHIQPDSVNKRRQRVRQRLGIIAKELDLCAYLINSVQ